MWLVRLIWDSLLCISNHWLWLGVVLQLWYPFNENWFSIKPGWHFISLDPLVCGFLFIQWIITVINPTKGPGLIIVSIMPWHLPRSSWPFRWNTKIYSLFIDWIFDHSTSTIYICNMHQATYPPGSYSSILKDSCNLWLDLIINHIWQKGWIWKWAEGSLFTPKVVGELQGIYDWFYYIMINKQP